jgi:hypothetical protein
LHRPFSFLTNPKGNTMHFKSLTRTIALSIGLTASLLAFAAKEGGDHHKPQFGGIVAEGKAFDAELVTKPDLITVHLNDHGKPMSTKGFKGKITLLSGTEKVDADLVSAGDTKLEAKGKFNVAAGTKAIVMVTPEGKTSNSFKFTLK